MNSNDILEKVRSIVADQLCLEQNQVHPDANFFTELGADSLDIVELVMAFEETFGIEIPDDAASEISTVGEAADFIRKRLEK